MSKRSAQVADLIRTELNKVIIKDFEAPMGTLISVSEVTISDDLKNATAYVSIIPQNKLGSGLESIKRFSGHAQKKLAKSLAIHNTPRINFKLDERDLKYNAVDEALKE
jgi:ribosome-binding factor A